MKVLTIKNPWATLIVNKEKTYEFRTWNTNYRGKILIHSSQTGDRKNILYKDEYINGAIIGEAEIVDCIKVDEILNNKLKKINPIIYKSNHIGSYAFVLSNIKKYNNPIYCKGKLGLWNIDEGELK